ncbi:MAG: hypothetical protein K6B70_01285 [Clostridia bacterium]|nr:hypothetical protein [Clostridia bacterium]
MTEKEKQEMYNRIISNSTKKKEDMYNRIISNHNDYINRRNNIFEDFQPEDANNSIKFNNVAEENKERFKSAIGQKAGTLTKAMSFVKAPLEGKTQEEKAIELLANKKPVSQNKNENIFKNVILPALVGPTVYKHPDESGYVAKRLGSGVLGGVSGMIQADSTELQNNLQKGEKKGFARSALDFANSSISNATPALLPLNVARKFGIELLTNKDASLQQKAKNALNINAYEELPFNKFKKAIQVAGSINDDLDSNVKNATDKITAPQRNLEERLNKEAENYNGATRLAGNVAQSVGYMLPSIGASMVAGPEAGLAVTGFSAKGTATEEALKKGAELDQAVKIGDIKGLTEVGTEMLTGGVNFFGKGVLDDIVEKGITKKVSNKVGQFLLKQGYDFAGEIGEEVISDLVGTLVDKGTVDPNATYTVDDLGETAVTTLLTTVVLKALGVPMSQIQKSVINNQQKNIQSQESDVSKSPQIQKENTSNISNQIEDKNVQNSISQELQENEQNSNKIEVDSSENIQNMKNKAQNYINKSKSQFINDLVSDLQTSKYSNKEILNQSVDEIINEINNNDGKVSKEKADELFDNLYSKLVKTDSDFYEQYKDLKDDLRKTKLYVPENVENDISDFGDFKRNNRGNLVLTNDNNNINIDTKYKELSEIYPELFPSDITNQSDQLQKISEVARDIKKTETNVQAYLDKNMGPDYKMWAKEDFNRILDKFQKDVNMAYRYNADKPRKSNFIIAKDELTEMYKSLPELRRNYEKVMNKEVLTERDRVQVDRLLKNEITIDEIPKRYNVEGIVKVFKAKQPLNIIQDSIKENKKNIRAIRMEQAQQDLGDLSKWKDKNMGLKFSRETASRNIYDVAPKEIAKRVDENYIQTYHINEAKAVRTINKYTDEIKDLKLSSHKKYNATFSMQEILDGELQDVVKTKKVSEAELVQIFGEGRITLDQLQETGVDTQKIIKSVETFRNIYDKLFDDVNEVLLKNGLEPVQKRANYFPHFSEAEPDGLLSTAAKLAGIDLSGELLPTDLAGKTQNFKPNKKFVGNFLQRSTDITDFNALKGFDRYIQGVTDVIYHTEDIMKFRALSDSIRNFYSTKEIKAKMDSIEESTDLTIDEKAEKIKELKTQTMNKSNLSNFIVWLDNYINILSGKKSINDRGMEKELSRKMYKAITKIESRIGANQVAGNIGVSFTNLAPLAQASAECSIPNLVKGFYGSMIANGKAIIGKRDTSFASESDFITRRRGTETTHTTTFDRITKPLDIITSSIDDVISEGIVRARYIQNLKNGMTQQEALHEADTYSAGLMADRSKGAMPTQFYSTNPLAKMINMFQVEVNNQYSYYFKDMKRNIQNNSTTKAQMVAKMTKSYAKLLIASYAMNELISTVRGNATRVIPDPIYIVKELIKGLGNDDKDDDWETIMGTAEEISANLPFANIIFSLFGESAGFDTDKLGRPSIAGAIPNFNNIGLAMFSGDSEYKKETVKKELEKPLYNLIFPKAGSQVKKTVQGAEALINEGSYTTSKNGEKKLQFKVDNKNPQDVFKALMFGKWSTSGAQDYDSKPLTEKEQKEMEELNISFKDYKQYKTDFTKLNQIKSDKNEDGKSISGSASGKKAYAIMTNKDYSRKEKEFLIKKLNSEDSEKQVSISQLEKLDKSEETYKYFYKLSAEKQKQFISDLEEYNFNSKKLAEYYKSADAIGDKYTKKTKEIKALGLDSEEEKKKISEINAEKKTELADNILSTNYTNKQKLYLYSKEYKSNNVKMAQALDLDADAFLKVESEQFKSDKYVNGKTVKNSKLNKVYHYVESLPNLSIAEKAILIKSQVSSFDKYNNQIVKYVDSYDLTTKEKEDILKNMGFKIKNGRVYD